MEDNINLDSQEVFNFVIDVMAERGADATITTPELISLIKAKFSASDSQIAGLIHRMRTKNKILENVSRGVYKLYNKRPIVAEFVQETDMLMDRLTRRLKATILDLAPDDFKRVQKFLRDIEALKVELEENTNTLEDL